MRHGIGYRKLGRESSHRKALLRNLATSFLTHGKVNVTISKAKELRPIVEKLITTAKENNLNSRRKVHSVLFSKEAINHLFEVAGSRMSKRPGGYTRITRFGKRLGDGAEMCNLELVDYHDHEGKAKRELKEQKAKKEEAANEGS